LLGFLMLNQHNEYTMEVHVMTIPLKELKLWGLANPSLIFVNHPRCGMGQRRGDQRQYVRKQQIGIRLMFS
jgi:hypothetical protein